MKTITLITLFVGALAFITNAYASISGNLAVTSDYLWRGNSLSANAAAVQGGLDYEGENFYTGVWVSNTAGAATGEEVDLYIGTNLYGFDVGITKYETEVLGEDTELYVGYELAGFGLYYAQSEEDSDIDFFSVSYGFDINESLAATLTYGSWSDEALTAGSSIADDYLQLDVSYGDLTLSILDADDNRNEIDVAVTYSWAL